jgi:hypothetical protein
VGLTALDLQLREPTVHSTKLTRQQIGSFRRAMMRGTPLPNSDFADAHAWALRFVDRSQHSGRTGATALLLLVTSGGAIMREGGTLPRFVIPLLLVACGTWMYALLLRHRVRMWLAENAGPEDERDSTIEQLLHDGPAASPDVPLGNDS